jgi:hypothetical protein
MNHLYDLNESSINNELIATSSSSTNTPVLIYNTNKNQPINVHVLRLHNVTQSRNFTCQAQNSFGLVVFNLSLVIKGNLI